MDLPAPRHPIRRPWLFQLMVFVFLFAGSVAPARAEWIHAARIRQLAPGMTQAQVIAILGTPPAQTAPAGRAPEEGEFLYFRFHQIAESGKQDFPRTIDDNPTLWFGRLRCLFRDGKLLATSGFWGEPQPPPKGTPQDKILLVDVAALYDGLDVIAKMNENLKVSEDAAQHQLDELRLQEQTLAAEKKKCIRDLKRFKGSDAEKTLLQQKGQTLQSQHQAKRDELNRFPQTARSHFVETIERYRDRVLPFLASAIVRFQQAKGYTCVYEINGNLFSTSPKPRRIRGTDRTADVLAWLNQLNRDSTTSDGSPRPPGS
jgi:hypothetical protein